MTAHIPRQHIIDTFARAINNDNPDLMIDLVKIFLEGQDILSLQWITANAIAGFDMAKFYFSVNGPWLAQCLSPDMAEHHWPIFCWIYHNIIFTRDIEYTFLREFARRGDTSIIKLDRWRCFTLTLFIDGLYADELHKIPVPFIHNFIEMASAGKIRPALIKRNISILKMWDIHLQYIDEEHCQMLGQVLIDPYYATFVRAPDDREYYKHWAEFLDRYLPK